MTSPLPTDEDALGLARAISQAVGGYNPATRPITNAVAAVVAWMEREGFRRSVVSTDEDAREALEQQIGDAIDDSCAGGGAGLDAYERRKRACQHPRIYACRSRSLGGIRSTRHNRRRRASAPAVRELPQYCGTNRVLGGMARRPRHDDRGFAVLNSWIRWDARMGSCSPSPRWPVGARQPERRGTVTTHKLSVEGREFTRLSVNMNAETTEALREMAARRRSSITEAVRRAISIAHFLDHEWGAGRKVIIRDEATRTEREVIRL